MPSIESIKARILAMLLEDFRAKDRDSASLKKGYEGISIRVIEEMCADCSKVDLELAFKELEKARLVGTGPVVPYENRPGSNVFIAGLYSKRIYAHLKEDGYKLASSQPATPQRKPRGKPALATVAENHFFGIHRKNYREVQLLVRER